MAKIEYVIKKQGSSKLEQDFISKLRGNRLEEMEIASANHETIVNYKGITVVCSEMNPNGLVEILGPEESYIKKIKPELEKITGYQLIKI